MSVEANLDELTLTVFPADGELFELFVEAVLEELGFRILVRPARGADGGRDLIVEQVFRDALGTDRCEKILVQCKHYAHGGRAVSSVGDFRDALIRNSCHRYLLVTSTTVTENLRKLFEAFNEDARFPGERADYWTGADILQKIKENPRLRELFFQAAPFKYREQLPAHQTIDALLESQENGTALLNTDGIIVSTNEQFKQLFPTAHEAQPCWLNYHSFRDTGPCACCSSETAFRRNDEVEAMAWSPIGPKGTLRWVQIRSVPIHDAHGELAGAVEVVRNIHSEMALNSLRRALCAAKDPKEILRQTLLSVAAVFGVEKCAVFQLAEGNELKALAAFRLDKSAVREQRDMKGIVHICGEEPSSGPPELPAIHCRCEISQLESTKPLLPSADAPESGDFAIIKVPLPKTASMVPHPFFESLDHWIAIFFGPEHPWHVFFVLGNNVPFPTTQLAVRDFLQQVVELTSLALLKLESSEHTKTCKCLDAPREREPP